MAKPNVTPGPCDHCAPGSFSQCSHARFVNTFRIALHFVFDNRESNIRVRGSFVRLSCDSGHVPLSVQHSTIRAKARTPLFDFHKNFQASYDCLAWKRLYGKKSEAARKIVLFTTPKSLRFFFPGNAKLVSALADAFHSFIAISPPLPGGVLRS